MTEPLVIEFPPETVEVLDDLSSNLKISRVEVISRGLGLLQLWVDAHKHDRTIVERPRNIEVRSDEYEIVVSAG
jgi:hypothetical protein